MEGQITLNEWMEWKEDIRRKLQETANNFVYIGYRLKQIRDSGMYDGCESIYEFAEKEYNLQRSTVSRFMAINDKFSKHGNSIELRDEFVGLNQSQLSEMLSLPVSDYDMITEDTSIKDIREIKSFNRDMKEPEPKPEETVKAAGTDQKEWTPLQKCIIDFFKDKLDLLDEVEKSYTIKDAAELMAPSGSRTHKKGIILLVMHDYDHGVNIKEMGKPEPSSMTWDTFFDRIREVFFDFADDYKDRLGEIYPESVPKEAESVPKAEKIEKNKEKSDEISENRKESKATADKEISPAAGGSEPKEEAKEENEEETKVETIPAAAGQEEIQQAYRKTFEIIRGIEKRLGERDWKGAHDGADALSDTIGWIREQNPEDINTALDAEFDNE